VGTASQSESLKPRIVLQDPVDPSEALHHGTPILAAAFSSSQGFLDAYSPLGKAGELAVVTRARPASGREVVLEVSWPGLPNRVYLRARVYRRRLGLLAKLHPDDATARDFLVQMAAGDEVAWFRRRHRRYCVRLIVVWRGFGSTDSLGGTVEDLSAGGMLISSPYAAPPLGEKMALRVRADAAGQDLIITGVVRHRRARTIDEAFGVEFEYRSSGEQRRLRQLLRVFASTGVVLL
jgi:hypothetical protein